ncbi:DUF6988 family protein [Stenotrophomonas maltophilia]|uniref:DUF6988 family protein n=2 Tax=Stenotrophomonas maltophilia TaxID=40324 RepID=UPI0006AC537E|nr:hypothetical protein [Stenotrophomonas maltophilia]KOQ57860.1 hypothetical protein ABW42_18445 [Stenotrophomonas maltophilia]MCF3528218.1 hypothetical protein [Stenotrophomonas maltophilia]MCF3532102.1 hypothetical protein [Stenotrophomonas maltophilia]OFV00731.1 hypothetical protein HMPREF3114_02775 [Stenotrophomonas sp. HMSC10F07]
MSSDVTDAILARCDMSALLSAGIRQRQPKCAPCCKRHDFAVCAIDLAFEHHGAIVALTRGGQLGASGALMRPLLEASSTAFWLVYCASDTDIDRLTVDPAYEVPEYDIPDWADVLKALKPIFPEIAHLQEALRKTSELRGLARWLHKYTHGGTPQLIRRDLASGWSEDETLLSLLRADLFLFLAASVQTVMSGDDDVRNYVFDARDRLAQEGEDRFGLPMPEGQPRQHPPSERVCHGPSFIAG